MIPRNEGRFMYHKNSPEWIRVLHIRHCCVHAKERFGVFFSPLSDLTSAFRGIRSAESVELIVQLQNRKDVGHVLGQ
jgi:hypothetical protein